MTPTLRLQRAPRQRRSRVMHDRLIDAATRLLEARPDARFTLREVAEAAGVSQGTIYSRFRTRGELLMAVQDAWWAASFAELPAFFAAAKAAPDREALVRCAVESYAGWVSTHARFTGSLRRACADEPELAARQARFNAELLARVTAAAQELPLDRLGCDEATLHGVIGLVVASARDALVGASFDPDALRVDPAAVEARSAAAALALLGPSRA